MIKVELKIRKVWHDISKLLVKDTLAIYKKAMTVERTSSLNTCRFTLLWSDSLYSSLMKATSPIYFRVTEDSDLLFLGQADPVSDIDWKSKDDEPSLDIEAVDWTVCLDNQISQSASYPAVVDGPSFFIYRKDNIQMSILYRILEICGISDKIDKNAPDIDVQIKHISWIKGSVSYRQLIDSLLKEYAFCLVSNGDKITWVRTAHFKDKHPEVISNNDIVGQIKKQKEYITYDGVSVKWPKVKIEDDTLLWRGNLPIGDTSNPRPGELIASGDYWPEDSDIIETWQNYGTEYLDTEWLSGKSRLKNQALSLISSSNWYIKDNKDEGVILDKIDGKDAIFEALRARIRYKNTNANASRLYYSNIYGKALIKYQDMLTSIPDNAHAPEEVDASYIYSKDNAERYASARYMWLIYGCFNIQFTSKKEYQIGQLLKLEQSPFYLGYIQVISSHKDLNGLYEYSALSAALTKENTNIINSSSGIGGNKEVDGITTRLAYKRSYLKPEKPVGDNPEGWSLDTVPDGYMPTWLSIATFSLLTGNLIKEWTDPVRVEGIGGGEYRGAHEEAPNDPLEGDFFIYTGATTLTMTQYHIYKYSSIDDIWVETTESDKVMACQRDALQIAKNTGNVEYCALLFVDLLVAGKLMVGGGNESKGLLCRFMNDDGNGNPIIEIRYDGKKLWWVDIDSGKMYGNFAQVVQYMPMTFDDSLDSNHPALFSFWIPDDADIEWVKVAVKGQPYRTYSAGISHKSGWHASTGSISYGIGAPSIELNVSTLGYNQNTDVSGSHTHSYSMAKSATGGGSHSHALESWGSPISYTGTSNPDNHSHTVIFPNRAADGGPHSHSIEYSYDTTGSNGSHSHTLPSNLVTGVSAKLNNYDHTHDIDISHGHDLYMGIIEGDNPSGMKLTWIEGQYSTQISVASEGLYTIGVNSKKGGWKSIRISSASLGRVQVQVICKLRIDTTTN